MRWRNRFGILVLSVLLLLAGAASTARDALRPGEFVWSPEVAPHGPLVVLVELGSQRAYVYRNGVRIGMSTVSTGRTGYETPPGVYTVLEKKREHYSNLYDDAPMPWMQRLTWEGLALHAGAVRERPASHGCVRLPPAFAERLFAATAPGTTVVVQAEDVAPADAAPGFLAPVDTTGQPMTSVQDGEYWNPSASPSGPLTIVLDVSNRRIVALRNAVRIGQSAIEFVGPPPTGTWVYVLLDGHLDQPSALVPDRPRLRWMRVNASARTNERAEATALQPGTLVVPPLFARQVYDLLRPGTTVVVTEEPVRKIERDTPLMRADIAHP